MEGKNNTFLIGFFVLSLVTGLVLFLIWMGQLGSSRDYNEYIVFMKESVAGIQNDSSVKYMGVDVGQVTSMDINSKNNKEVEVHMKIKKGTPIKQDTIAQLKVFGITGLTFIELSGGSKDSPMIKPDAEGRLVIRSTKSQISNIIDNINTALNGFGKVMTDENAKHLSEILSNTAQVTNELKGVGTKIDKLADKTTDALHVTKAGFKKVGEAGDAIKYSARKLDKLTIQTGQLVNEAKNTVQIVNTQTLPKTNALIDEMNTTVATYDRLGRQIEEHPSSLVWGK